MSSEKEIRTRNSPIYQGFFKKILTNYRMSILGHRFSNISILSQKNLDLILGIKMRRRSKDEFFRKKER